MQPSVTHLNSVSVPLPVIPLARGIFASRRGRARGRVSALAGPARAGFGPRLFINFLFLFLASFGNL
jgi:hypothetical protein